MIELHDLTCGYDGIYPVKELSAQLPSTGLIAITGASGCGKTTLLRCLAGLLMPASGGVSGLPKKLSMVFQEDRLLPWLGVRENVLLSNAAGDADIWLDAVELDVSARDKPIAELSGGMQRRVAIARALNFKGDALLMDEPMKGLDAQLARRIMGRILKLYPLVIITAHEEAEGAAILHLR